MKRKKQRQLGEMGGNMGVSGALRIKEKERNKKQTALSSAHLERHNGRSTGWMILKFYLGAANIHMQRVSNLQLDPTVKLGDIGFAS